MLLISFSCKHPVVESSIYGLWNISRRKIVLPIVGTHVDTITSADESDLVSGGHNDSGFSHLAVICRCNVLDTRSIFGKFL